MNLNIQICVPSYPISGMRYLPLVWAYLKSYHTHHGEYTENVNWLEPLQNKRDIDKFLLQGVENVDVLGISNYMWNSKVNFDLAKQVKKQNPNCFIVCGGPEFNMLDISNFDYIDAYIPIEGEVSFSNLLDKLKSREDWKTVGGIVYLENNKIKKNPPLPYIRDWFFSPILEHKEYFEELIQRNKEEKFETLLQFETTRGCPYGCTFCDWGGGIHTKVRNRPLEILKEEITWTGQNKIFKYFITDANFGIYERDIDVAKHIVDTRNTYGWPKGITYQSAKNQTNRIIQIAEILYKGKMMSRHMISVQSTDDHVLTNIDRANLPTSKQSFIAHELNKKQVPVKSQIIIGLPGDNINKLKKTVSDLYDMGVSREIEYFIFGLFPNAPASEASYIEKHKLKTVQAYSPVTCRNLNNMEGYSASDIQICNGLADIENESVYQDAVWDVADSKSAFVVESESYDRKEFAEMYTWMLVLNGLVDNGLFKDIADFYKQHGISYKDFFHNIIEDFKSNKEFKEIYDYIEQQSQDLSNGIRPYEEIQIPGSTQPVAFESNLVMQSWVAKNKELVRNDLMKMVIDRFGYHDPVKDLSNFCLDRIVGFDVINEKEITYDYDWIAIIKGMNFVDLIKCPTTVKWKNTYIDNFKKLNVKMDLYYYTLCLIHGRWRKKMNYDANYISSN